MPPKAIRGDQWQYRPGGLDGSHPAAPCLVIGGQPVGIGLKPVGDTQVQPLLRHRSVVGNRESVVGLAPFGAGRQHLEVAGRRHRIGSQITPAAQATVL